MLTECSVRANYRPIQRHLCEAQGRAALSKDSTWDPREYDQRILSGPNSYLRHNIKFYLRPNSTVCLWTMLDASSSVTALARSLKISRQSVYRIRAEVEAAWCGRWVILLCTNVADVSRCNALACNLIFRWLYWNIWYLKFFTLTVIDVRKLPQWSYVKTMGF